MGKLMKILSVAVFKQSP